MFFFHTKWFWITNTLPISIKMLRPNYWKKMVFLIQNGSEFPKYFLRFLSIKIQTQYLKEMGFFIQCGSEFWFHFFRPIWIKTQTQNGSEFCSLEAVGSGTRFPRYSKKAFGPLPPYDDAILTPFRTNLSPWSRFDPDPPSLPGMSADMWMLPNHDNSNLVYPSGW